MKKLCTLALIIFFSSCEKNDSSTNLSIHFNHTVNSSTSLELDSTSYLNSSSQSYTVNRLWYLISDLKLHKSNGELVDIEDIHFVDVNNRETTVIDFGTIDEGIYNMISFTFGLDSSKNVDNQYVNDSWHSDMFWPPMMGSGGYHYMKLEGTYDTINQFYNCHTGPTMGSDYSFNVELPIDFNTNDTEGIMLNIIMNVNNWFENPNNFVLSSNGIMMNMGAQMQLKQNGQADVFSSSVTYSGNLGR